MGKKEGYFNHICDLPSTSEDILLDNPPYLGKTQKWLRSFHQYIYLNEKARITKEFFRSYAAVRVEKRRQALRYPATIHPFSTFAIYRERLLCVMWLFCFATDPIIWSFSVIMPENHPIYIFQTILDILFFINAFVICSIGYVVPLTKEIVLSPKEIFKYRIWTYTIPECIACIPISLIMKKLFLVNPRQSRWMVLNICKTLRWLRLVEFYRYLSNIFYDLNVREWVHSWFVFLIVNVYLIFWITCALFFISVLYYTYDDLPENSFLRNKSNVGDADILEPEDSFQYSFLTILTIATCHYFGASQGYIAIKLNLEKCLCSLTLMFGYIVCIIGTAKLLEIFGVYTASQTKYDEWIYQVAKYAQSKDLPKNFKKRLDIYHDYKYQRRYFDEDVILATLSDHLRHEIILYGCRNVMNKVPLLQGMSKSILGSVIAYMKREIYLPNDVVLKYGEPLTKMFWVSFGTLAVHYGPNVVEILHFEDGDHFGDLSITKDGGTAQLTVVSLEITEIFTLSRKDVKHCTAFLKEMKVRIHKLHKEKFKLYPTLARMMTNEEAHNAVVADLRRGRILESDNWRLNP